MCIDVFMYFILRVPKSCENRIKWIEAIEKNQRFDYNKQIFNVCKRHFCERDFLKSGNTPTLITDAVPSIFEKRVMADSTDKQIIGNAAQPQNQCSQCPPLMQKVKELEKEMFILKTQHDIETQKLQRQIDLLKNKNEQKIVQVKSFQKEMNSEKKLIIRLKDVITDLKNENYISSEDEKILNVIINSFVYLSIYRCLHITFLCLLFQRCLRCKKLLIVCVRV